MRKKTFEFLAGVLFLAILSTQFSCGVLETVKLERNRKLWDESKIKNYKMTINISKTGHATPNGKFIIIVRGGVAKSIKSVDFKPDIEFLDSDIQFGRYDTIEDIFNFIESAENDKQKNNNSWDRREIEYDAKFGYPKKVDLDQSGVFDDELFFEVLEFEVAESSDGEPAEKSLPLKIVSVPASEITTVAFSVSRHAGPLVGSDESYTTSGATSFSNDGTALKSSGVKNYDTRKKQGSEGQKYQGVVSKEQFEKLAQTLADNNFSNLEDSTEIISDTTSYNLIVTYSGKTKAIKTSNTGKDTAEIKEILDAFENLKNQIDWKQIN